MFWWATAIKVCHTFVHQNVCKVLISTEKPFLILFWNISDQFFRGPDNMLAYFPLWANAAHVAVPNVPPGVGCGWPVRAGGKLLQMRVVATDICGRDVSNSRKIISFWTTKETDKK